MANTKAAQKYIKQSQARRLRNRQQRSALRGCIKSFRNLMESTPAPTQEAADKQFSLVTKALDQAAAKNLLHSNAAARTKSRLSALKKKTCSS
jgi:small subunit ribosomal protein S20